MKEWNAFQCPFCGRFDSEVVDNYRRCKLCGCAWDRVYGNEHIHK